MVLAAADITAINTAIATILSKVPANTTLTDEQRLSYNAINVANKVFAEDCLAEAQLNGTGIIPDYQVENDFETNEANETIIIDNQYKKAIDMI